MAVTGTPLVCLDKDGTLVVNDPFNVDPRRMRPVPDAAEAIARLAHAGFALAVVTNQPGVALGRFPEAALAEVHAWLAAFFAAAGARLQGFYYCPHVDGCACRKPAAGLVSGALADLGADARESWMVGDILDDVEAGARAGCRTALVDNGNETEWRYGPFRAPTVSAPTLSAAAAAISEASR